MKLLVTADVHITNKPYPNSLELGKQVLADLSLLAKQNGTDGIVIVGDLWDQKHATPVEVLLAIKDWIDSYTGYIFWVRGNHEVQSRTDPEESLVRLFEDRRDDVFVFNKPDIVKLTDTYLHMMPWYPTETIKKKLVETHKVALKERDKVHYLFAHCGLREGKVNPDGFTVPKDLSVKDLQPELYKLVILGDYHGHQFIGDNVFYTGEPVQRGFGSWGSFGPWLVDTRTGSFSQVPLPSRYPRFIKTIFSEGDRLDRILDEYDRHRITCPPTLLEAVAARYPFAEVIPIGGVVESRTDPKVSNNHQSILSVYVAKTYPKEGKTFLAKARSYLED